MISYERQCQLLLLAFPAEFRGDRGADLLAALLDDAKPDPRCVPVRTGVDLLRAGTGLRVSRTGAARSLRASAFEGIALAAVIGLGVQAALAVASTVYFAEHGLVFYVPTDVARFNHTTALGAQWLATWVALAVISVAAFAAVVRGAWRIGASLALAASAYLISVAVWLAASLPATHAAIIQVAGTGTAPLGGVPAGPTPYIEFIATPGLLAIGAIAAACAVAAAFRSRRQRRSPRTWWWLATGAALAALFSLVGDGNAAKGPSSNLSTAYPPQGGIMTVFQVLFASAVIIAVLWSRLDPRPGWAIAALSAPFIAHQFSDLTIGNFYYGYLYQPGWQTALPLILACAGLAILAASSIRTSLRLHRR